MTRGMIVAALFLCLTWGCERNDRAPERPAMAESAAVEHPQGEQGRARGAASQPVPEVAVKEEVPGRFSEPVISPVHASEEGGIVRLDRVDPPPEVRERFDPTTRTVPYEPDEWPGPFQYLDSLDVLTPEEIVTVELAEVYRYHRMEGTRETFSLRSEPSKAVDHDTHSWTFVAPPGVLSPDARVRAPQAERVEASMARSVWARFTDSFGDEMRNRLDERLGLSRGDKPNVGELPGYIEVFEAEFPEPYERLVTVNVHGDYCFSSAYLVDETERVYTAVVDGHTGYYCFEPIVFADLRGDGHWGVVYRIGVDPHPFRIRWLGFGDDGTPVQSTLEFID